MTDTIFGISYNHLDDLFHVDNDGMHVVSIIINNNEQFLNMLYTILSHMRVNRSLSATYNFDSNLSLDNYGLEKTNWVVDINDTLYTYYVDVRDVLRIVGPDIAKQYIDEVTDMLLDISSELFPHDTKSARAI